MAHRRTLGQAAALAAASILVVAGSVGPGAQDRSEPTPVRQNPNIDRPITNEGFDSTVIMLLQRLVAAYGPIANSNDRPNPYTRIEPFGEPPPGNNGEWAGGDRRRGRTGRQAVRPAPLPGQFVRGAA